MRKLVVLIVACFCALSCTENTMMSSLKKPGEYSASGKACLVETWTFEDYDAELLVQENGPSTWQRVIKVIPRNVSGKLPAVVVPFYFPEAMLGFQPGTGEVLPKYKGVEMMLHLAKRGIASVSGESYHLTYLESEKSRDDFSRWQDAGEQLNRDYPEWSGMGKLVADCRLLIDLMEDDPRIDGSRIGIAGHSLGGKVAYYTGCLDSRVKVILASDFGLLWEQSNWEKCWYWGDKLEILKTEGLDNLSLFAECGGKPFCLIAGQYDDERSNEAVKSSAVFSPETFLFVNHASGHRPPQWALDEGYDFMEKYLK